MNTRLINELRKWCRIVIFLGAVAVLVFMFSADNVHVSNFVGYFSAFFLGVIAGQRGRKR